MEARGSLVDMREDMKLVVLAVEEDLILLEARGSLDELSLVSGYELKESKSRPVSS